MAELIGAEPIRPKLFSVPVGIDISTAVAQDLLARFGGNHSALADAILLLPNNRAISALTAAFVRHSENGLLLPRMVAIGDLALDEALGPLLDPLAMGAADILPAIGDMERLLLLVKLVRQRRPDATPAEALHLARLLAETLDQLDVEMKSVSDIQLDHDDEDLASHWQGAYADLIAISADYHAALAKRGLMNPAARRNALLALLGERLKAGVDAEAVIAVGIATPAPAIAQLLKCVALLPNGMVVLPHIDLGMDADSWDALGPFGKPQVGERPKRLQESHPQFHLKLLLDRMAFRKEEVELYVPAGATRDHARLSDIVADIFCPAIQTTSWQSLPPARKTMPQLRLAECSDSAEEALAISALVREALEAPQKRIAIITPDREIAVRVAAQLRRWGIVADDSAGEPLSQQPVGILLLAIAQMLGSRFGSVALLAVLKHPLAAMGDGRLGWLEKVRQLDLALRGPRTGLGLEAITARVFEWERDEEKPLLDWWSAQAEQLAAFDIKRGADFGEMLSATSQLADALTEGAIWKGAAGRSLGEFVQELQLHDLTALRDSDGAAFAAVMHDLLSNISIRPAFGAHPRVSIYGLLEARLQTADLVICAGLNEGSWPQLPQPDPWLAPRLRRDLDMPGLDRNIGLSAHDLGSALGASEVVLTRAKRDRSGPTIASRFLLRIQALLGKNLREENRAIALAQKLDAARLQADPYVRPAPLPSKKQRRVDISITQMDVLKADPYAFYARNILGLRVLKPVDSEPDAAWKGTAIHDLLKLWADEDDHDPDRLVSRAHAMLKNPALHPSLRMLWQPRISAGLRWIADETKRLRDEEQRQIIVTEQKGKVTIDGILIHGRIDRIDACEDGRLVIVDYKSGSPPAKKKVEAGYALQLGLAGLMAETGGVKGANAEVAGFEYWSLAKSKNKKRSNPFGYADPALSKNAKGDAPTNETFVAFAQHEASTAIALWITGQEPFTAKLKPDYAVYDDYDQLMRLDEWRGQGSWQEGDNG